MQPTFGWWGNGNTANKPITGKGNNCGVTGFTDHAADCETGLVYMQARHMDPVSSRFLSIDPVGFLDDGRTGMVNRYSYTLNVPVNGIDPDGENPLAIGIAVTYVVNEARRGAVKGAGWGVATSIVSQGLAGEANISKTAVLVSGLKGAAVGSTHEVFEFPTLTSGVAGVAGFLDGTITSLANDEKLGDAWQAGLKQGSEEAGLALVGATLGDEAGAAAAVGLTTTAAHSDKVGLIVDSISNDVGGLFEDLGNDLSGVRDGLTDMLSREQDRYDDYSED